MPQSQDEDAEMREDIKEIRRPVPMAELFVLESAADKLADAVDSADKAEGMLLGEYRKDSRGIYGFVTGISMGISPAEDAIGWFRSSPDGYRMEDGDIEVHKGIFGGSLAFATMADPSQQALAFYIVDDGRARVARAMVVDGE